jgi:hypothetical protein
MEKTHPTTGEFIELTKKLINFKTFESLHFTTREVHNKNGLEKGTYGCIYTISIFINNESECEKIKKITNDHFLHIKGVGLFKEFFIPSEKRSVWKQSKIKFK